MLDFFARLFDTSGFPPRWHCGYWTSGHGWLHILSDLGVWSAYLAIPCVLGFFVIRKKDMPFRTIFWLFGAFILACGTTHLMEAIIFWWPAYRLAGLIKLFTALVSWATVLALVPATPRVLAMRSPEELEQEIAERKRAEADLRAMQADLERRVAERTAELANANEGLQREIQQRADAERLLSFALRAAQAGVWDWDVVSARVRCSEEFNALVGSEPANVDWSFDEWLSLIHPDDRLAVQQEAWSAVEQQRSFKSSYRIVRPTGEQRWLSGRGRMVTDHVNRVARITGLTIDITERIRVEEEVRREVEQRKQAERRLLQAQGDLEEKVRQRTAELTQANQQLLQEVAEKEAAVEAHQRSEAMFQVLFDSSPDAILVTTMDGRIQHCNVRSESAFGYERKELIGRQFESLLCEQFHEIIRKQWTEEQRAAYRSRSRGESFDLLGKRKNGEDFPADILLATVQTPDGPRILANIRDASHRKANEAIIRSRVRQQAALAEFSQRAFQSAEISTILQDASEVLAKTLHMERSLVAELARDGDFLMLRAGSGWDSSWQEWLRVRIEPGTETSYCLAVERPIVFENLETEKRFRASSFLEALGACSGGCVVIKSREGRFGILGVYSQSLRKFTTEDYGFLQLFADMLAAIVDRSQAERLVQTSLAEKEVLLKEIHHRVKNNLQIISSLLDLQSEHTDNEAAAEMFWECQSRVRSMALVHERLYRSNDLAKVDFAGYLESLAEYLLDSYSTDRQCIRLELDVAPDIRLPIDLAIPCGLLVNELVSNCLKHAFQGQTVGLLQIQLTHLPPDKMFLRVADSGKGLPDALSLENAPTFGLQLVAMLIKQLGGKLALSRTGGTMFNVTFPLNKSGSPGEIDK